MFLYCINSSDLLDIKSGLLPVRKTRVDCFSHISVVSCERWSSSKTHSVSAALPVSTYDRATHKDLCVGGRRSCVFLCCENKLLSPSCIGGLNNNLRWKMALAFKKRDSWLTRCVLLFYLLLIKRHESHMLLLLSHAAEHAHPAEGTLPQIGCRRRIPHWDEYRCAELLNAGKQKQGHDDMRVCETLVGFGTRVLKPIFTLSPQCLTRKWVRGFLWEDTTKYEGLGFCLRYTLFFLS